MSLGEHLTFGEVHVVIHADAASTGGALSVIEEVPPLADRPLHVHTDEDELFYTLEGEHVIQVLLPRARRRRSKGRARPRRLRGGLAEVRDQLALTRTVFA
jgi:hypothetical protein